MVFPMVKGQTKAIVLFYKKKEYSINKQLHTCVAGNGHWRSSMHHAAMQFIKLDAKDVSTPPDSVRE